MGYDSGLTFSPMTGPPHVLRRASKFTRRLVESSRGGDVYALSETADHMSLLRDFVAPLGGLNPVMMGLEKCESLLAHVNTKKMIADKY